MITGALMLPPTRSGFKPLTKLQPSISS
jgi:hypothetical protein